MKTAILVFVSWLALFNSALAREEVSCRKQIREITCVVDAPADNQSLKDRPCLATDESYFKQVEKAYDQLPKPYQKLFCHLQNIYIENKLDGYTGYSWYHNTSDVTQFKGAYVRLNRQFLDKLQMNLTDMSQWATEGFLKAFDLSQNRPHPFIKSNGDALFYLLAHELTHTLDFSNHFNKVIDKACARQLFDTWQADCALTPASFASLSWVSSGHRKIKDTRPEIDQTLTIFCCHPGETRIAAENSIQAMNWLYYETDFINDYSAMDPWEDLAETMGFYIIKTRHHNTEYNFHIPGKLGYRVYPLYPKMYSPLFRRKLEFARKVLAGDLKYPEKDL